MKLLIGIVFPFIVAITIAIPFGLLYLAVKVVRLAWGE